MVPKMENKRCNLRIKTVNLIVLYPNISISLENLILSRKKFVSVKLKAAKRLSTN